MSRRRRDQPSYVLNMLRHSARKRNLPFTLTLAEFKEFCAKTGYLERRGNKPDSLTVDRIDNNRGYTLDNIRAITHAENTSQGADNTPRDERGCERADVDDNAPEGCANDGDPF